MKSQLFTLVLAIGIATALVGSALAAPPAGKGKNKNEAITAIP